MNRKKENKYIIYIWVKIKMMNQHIFVYIIYIFYISSKVLEAVL